MTKTKIEWCDMTWNPVTGCLHDCPYCYAADIARRFGGHHVIGAEPTDSFGGNNVYKFGGLHDIEEPLRIKTKGKNRDKGVDLVTAPFPFTFDPTIHRYRFDQPQHIKRRQNIFVCSMADLFGDFIPDDWIQEVFEACKKAPQHRYLFLTKNPGRLYSLSENDLLPKEYWYGCSIENEQQMFRVTKDDGSIEKRGLFASNGFNTLVSIEPLLEWWENGGDTEKIRKTMSAAWISKTKWVIVGAETGNRKGKVIPKREWIENIVNECRRSKVPVFLKNSLAEIWNEPLIQEYPWSKN